MPSNPCPHPPTPSPNPGRGGVYALTAYGIPHTMGYLATQDGTVNPKPLSPLGFLDAAVEMGLPAVEMPILPHRWSVETLGVERLKEELEARNLRIVPDYMALPDAEPEQVRTFLEGAAYLGANVVRTLVSGVICGDRRKLVGGWAARIDLMAKHLREALAIAEHLGLSIAVENHQDSTSHDLIRLYEMSGESPAYGVCLDTGNPLAVGEGPVEFAERVGPLLRHIHLKDYTIHYAPEGYRLVRCAAGDGVVDFPTILNIAAANGFPMIPGIEIAAQMTRTIPLLEDSWWDHYPDGHGDYLPEALRVLWKHGRPMDEPYGSAWENGKDSPTVLAEEWDVLRRSVDYFQKLNVAHS